MNESALRAVLWVVAAFHLALGLLALLAPGTFFDLVGPYPPENQHYLGDVGAFYLAAGVGVGVAAERPSWRVPVLAIGAVWYGVHAINHLVDVGEAETTAKGIFDTVALAVGAAGAGWLAWVSARREATGGTGAPHTGTGRSRGDG